MEEKHFKEDLKASFEGKKEREKFYKGLGLKNIRFVDDDMSLQKHDIDVVANHGDKTVYISEKIRMEMLYPKDILIEIYSSFQSKTPGWLKDSTADSLFCFYRDKVVAVNVESLKNALHLFNDTHPGFLKSIKRTAERLIEEKKSFGKLENTGKVDISVINAYNNNDGSKYNTISIAIKANDLEKYGAKIYEY